jgi:hypothetical protein
VHPSRWTQTLRRPEATKRSREPSLATWCGRCGALRYSGEPHWFLPNMVGRQLAREADGDRDDD